MASGRGRAYWVDSDTGFEVEADCRSFSAGAITNRLSRSDTYFEEDGWLFWPDDPNYHYRLWFLRPNPAQRTHHLQMIQHDHPDILALLAFRDALRRDPKAREAYTLLKEGLAKEYKADRNAYTNAKTEFVQSILKASGSDPSSRKPV